LALNAVSSATGWPTLPYLRLIWSGDRTDRGPRRVRLTWSPASLPQCSLRRPHTCGHAIVREAARRRAYWRRAIRAAPLAEDILNNTPTLLDRGELGDDRWWLTCEWHDLSQFTPRPGRIEAAGGHRPPASHHPSNGVELVHPDGALTTVLTAADGLQNHTAIARHGNTVYVADPAYFTATDPNLLTAPYRRPLGGRLRHAGVRSRHSSGVAYSGIVQIRGRGADLYAP
jgi:hypothetical protein